MDRGAWRVIIHGITKSWTGMSTNTFTFTSHLTMLSLKRLFYFCSKKKKIDVNINFDMSTSSYK